MQPLMIAFNVIILIEYLKDPPNTATLKKSIKMLGITPIDMIRKTVSKPGWI